MNTLKNIATGLGVIAITPALLALLTGIIYMVTGYGFGHSVGLGVVMLCCLLIITVVLFAAFVFGELIRGVDR